MGQISSSIPDMTAEPGFIMIDKPYQVINETAEADSLTYRRSAHTFLHTAQD